VPFELALLDSAERKKRERREPTIWLIPTFPNALLLEVTAHWGHFPTLTSTFVPQSIL
jgi:hypothetical protein